MIEISTQPHYLAVITAATQSRNRPAAKAVVAALLEAEKSAKKARLTYPIDLLLGQWQLCFATGTRKLRQGGIALSSGFYLPGFVQAQIGFERLAEPPNALRITNQLQAATLRFQIVGPARYSTPKNLLAFDLTRMELSLLGRPLYRGQFRGGQAKTDAFDQTPIAKLPFFSFFLITAELIAARGRGGGLAIWARARD
jgi:hypothetical protein